MKNYKIGKITKSKQIKSLSSDDIQKYIIFQGWENLENCIIKGKIWTTYLNKHDYKYVMQNDISKDDIIRQIIEQLNPNKIIPKDYQLFTEWCFKNDIFTYDKKLDFWFNKKTFLKVTWNDVWNYYYEKILL